MTKLQNKIWEKENLHRGSVKKEFSKKGLKKTEQELKRKNKDRYHDTGIRVH